MDNPVVIDPLFDKFFRAANIMFWYTPLNPYQQFSNPYSGIGYYLRRGLYYFVLASLLLLLTLDVVYLANSLIEGGDFSIFLMVTVWFVLAINAYETTYFVWNATPEVIELIKLLLEDFPKTRFEKNRVKAEDLANDWVGKMRVQVQVFLAAHFNMLIMPLIFSTIGYFQTGVWVRRLPLHLWFPFDPVVMPIYPFIYVLEMWLFALNTFILVANCSLLGAITMVVCMQFKIVALNFRTLQITGDYDSDLRSVERLIKQHNRALFIAKRTKEIFSFFLLVSFTIASICLCIFMFLIITETHVVVAAQYVTNFICYLVYNAVYAYFGNEIIENSEAIALAAYDSNWVMADVRIKKLIIIVIRRAQSPEFLTGMGFFECSFTTLSKILATSYSYFTVLRTKYK